MSIYIYISFYVGTVSHQMCTLKAVTFAYTNRAKDAAK